MLNPRVIRIIIQCVVQLHQSRSSQSFFSLNCEHCHNIQILVGTYNSGVFCLTLSKIVGMTLLQGSIFDANTQIVLWMRVF